MKSEEVVVVVGAMLRWVACSGKGGLFKRAKGEEALRQ